MGDPGRPAKWRPPALGPVVQREGGSTTRPADPRLGGPATSHLGCRVRAGLPRDERPGPIALLSPRGRVRPALFRASQRSAFLVRARGHAPHGEPPRRLHQERRTRTLPIPYELAADLAGYLEPIPRDAPAFPLPLGEGASMLRSDLVRAEIPYRDEAGNVFDFHSLRCQCATLADLSGASPRVVQRLMRHSKLEMTDRYTRPRMHDIEGAAAGMPSLRPVGPYPGTAKATGTDGQVINNHVAHHLPTGRGASRGTETAGDGEGLSEPPLLLERKPWRAIALEGPRGFGTEVLSNDRGGARTHDQRINLPHRLSPTSPIFGPGRCWSGLSHRHRRRAASSLWGWGRRSGGPLPADRPIPRAFHAVTMAVAGCVVASGALRVSQHTAACTPLGWGSSRGGLLFSDPKAQR